MKILTQSGFKSFSGVLYQGRRNNLLKVRFAGGEIICTHDHLFLMDNLEWIEAQDLEVGFGLYGNKLISDIIPIESHMDVFDIDTVEDTNSYYSNGVVSHNCNLLYVDEYGIVDNKIAPAFMTASYPVVFSSKKAKIIISSTPLGYNHFYSLWKDAELGKNGFVPVKIHYSEHPGRDSSWADEQLKLLGRRAFNQEVLCQFAGSSNTLLDSTILERIHVQDPITEKDGLKIFAYPVPDRKYVMTVDTAEGIGQDRSTFVVMDITERPYRIVATYQSDSISYLFFPDKIKKVASDYNEAYVLVETNSVGNQVAAILHNDLEYENLLRFISEQKKGQILSSDSRAKYGLMMSAKAKSIGCRALRTLMEEDLITINDSEILHEFNNFVEKGNTFKADEGYHDDLVMTLVSFAYLNQDKTFQTYIDTSRSMEFGKQITRETGDIGNPSFFYFDDGSDIEVEEEVLGNW